jgi:hypothetical protein
MSFLHISCPNNHCPHLVPGPEICNVTITIIIVVVVIIVIVIINSDYHSYPCGLCCGGSRGTPTICGSALRRTPGLRATLRGTPAASSAISPTLRRPATPGAEEGPHLCLQLRVSPALSIQTFVTTAGLVRLALAVFHLCFFFNVLVSWSP